MPMSANVFGQSCMILSTSRTLCTVALLLLIGMSPNSLLTALSRGSMNLNSRIVRFLFLRDPIGSTSVSESSCSGFACHVRTRASVASSSVSMFVSEGSSRPLICTESFLSIDPDTLRSPLREGKGTGFMQRCSSSCITFAAGAFN